MDAGLDDIYMDNKSAGYAPADLPEKVANILQDTYWTLVYQEQVMKITSELAGFTLRESDDIRRAMGKKKVKVLAGYEDQFVAGCIASGLDKTYSEDLWEVLKGFAKYAFNKSHSVAYSIITYACAWLKAHYSKEFFCALMTVRSQSMQPKDWAKKAPEYIHEAKMLGVTINAPSVNTSDVGFTIVDDEIYFGLSAIKKIGKTSARTIVRGRRTTSFRTLEDFIARINISKLNVGHFQSLVYAGAFDKLGYDRNDLIRAAPLVYKYQHDLVSYYERKAQNETRVIENQEIIPKLERKKELQRIKRLKRERDLTEDEELFLEEVKGLRKKAMLKTGELPEFPAVKHHRQIVLDARDLELQSEYIGCHTGAHPALLVFPKITRICSAQMGSSRQLAGEITRLKVIKDKRGRKMAFMQLIDGTGIAEGTIFARQYNNMVTSGVVPEEGNMVRVTGRIEQIDPQVRILINSIQIHRSIE